MHHDHHEHHSRVISPSWGWHLLLFSQSPHDHRPWLRHRDSDAVVPSPKIPDSIYAGSDQIGGRGTKRNDQMGRRGHRLDARRMVVGNDQIGPRTPLPCSSVHPPTAYNADFKSRQQFFVILSFYSFRSHRSVISLLVLQFSVETVLGGDSGEWFVKQSQFCKIPVCVYIYKLPAGVHIYKNCWCLHS